MKPEYERKLWRNWMFLKQELPVPDITDKMIAAGVFTEQHKIDINTVKPNSKLMRAEKFLNILLETGDDGYEKFCKILGGDSSGKFEEINEKMEIAEKPKTEPEVTIGCEEQKTQVANGEQEKNPASAQSRSGSSVSRANSNVSSTPDPVQAAESVQAAAAAMANVAADNTGVDMKTLETELVRIAPTIAELFQKIVQTTQHSSPSWDELQRVKADNERLRKLNRALIEKLNTFQKQIIQLQLENKKLRDSGVCGVETESKAELDKKAEELDELKQKLEKQKQELVEKDEELNEQLRKIREIEEENERQKVQILKLEVLHDEGVSERSRQQMQIHELRDEKEKQRQKIDLLEDMQRKDEERLERLEARLRLLEQLSPVSSSHRSSVYAGNARRRSTRVVSPPRSMPWMSGVVNRSHHANVKFTPPPPRGGKAQEKGWSF